MKRTIEELIEKRKKQQDILKKDLEELGNALATRRFPWQRRPKINDILQRFHEDLSRLITAQDQEWDAYNNNHATMVFKSLQWKIEKLSAEYSHVKTLLINFINLEKSLQGLIDSLAEKTPPGLKTVARLKEIKDELSVYQYSDFEERFRGDEQGVKEKLGRYVPLFAAHDRILDIGCGRGEFIELLRAEGKKAEGIDISASMLRVAREKQITCTQVDALAFLNRAQEETYGGIFSSQVIEHLQPDYLRSMVLQCRRVLKKGAPLVLETVNPLSLFALSHIYFLDVTHHKPLHPEYMRYLVESSGFADVRILYADDPGGEGLMEVSPQDPIAREFNTNVDKLNKILFASPVYAVMGSKS